MIEVCVKYNASFINAVSMIVSVAMVMLFSVGIDRIQSNAVSNQIEKFSEPDSQNKVETDVVIVDDEKEMDLIKQETKFDWYIEIPKINLCAPIEEGTTDEILNRSIGHFENTSRRNGNCCLAAHNRGYQVNFFARVKELEENDIIYYFVDEKKYQYQVVDMIVIYETDWSVLEETKDNRITLITCIENREEYRLCVQAVLKE